MSAATRQAPIGGRPAATRTLTQTEFGEIEKALGEVIFHDGGRFDAFEHDFAHIQADRMEKYGRSIVFSDRQWTVVRGIQRKIREG